ALRAHGDVVRLAEFAERRAGPADGAEHGSVERELDDLARKTVDHEHRLAADVDVARQAGEFHLAAKSAIRVENLDARILAVRYPEIPGRVDRDGVCDLKLPRPR